MGDRYVSGKEASKILGVHQRTLYQWEEKHKISVIRTPGGHRKYNVGAFLSNQLCANDEECINNIDKLDTMAGKLNISYVRVSSIGQKDDLERQKKQLNEKFPRHVMIQDIGSGMNLNKKGIRKIIHLAIEGKINEVVVAYKDRLARFGFELIEDIIKTYSNGKIIVINKKDDVEPEEELVKDVLQVMNIFVAKMNGLRKYKRHNAQF
jgi:putative resolvase